MIIGGIQKTTLIDYPGKLAATIFTSGCNFFCGWCYSRELVVPELIQKQPKISEQEIFDFLETKKGLLEGVVICGGEPTLHGDLPEFIKKIKEMGFSVKLDTNGSNPAMLKELIDKKLIDYVAMDIKTSKEKYQEVLKGKVRLEDVSKSVEILKEGKIPFQFRTTVVPSVHEKEDFLSIAKWIGGKDILYYLQYFRPVKTIDPAFEEMIPFEKDWMEDVQKQIASYFKLCEIRG